MVLSNSSIYIDYIVFVVLILASLAVTFYTKWCGPKEKTKADYVFATGRQVSMGAMLLSLARGTLGVRSFLGYPSEMYYFGSGMWETLYGILLAYPIVSYVFVPVYYSLGITSVYQYLDLRFKSQLVRSLASGTYIIRSLLILGVTVYTPCVALKTVIGFPYWASIVGITAISTVCAVIGGLRAAILADVVQGLIMIGCSLAIVIQGSIDTGGPDVIIKANYDNGRINIFDFDLDPSVRVATVSALFGQLFMSLSIFGCQQTFVQRYVSMNSIHTVRRTLWANIPVIAVLFSLSWVAGMVIYADYINCDPLSLGYISKIDEIVPFYVEDKFTYIPGLLGVFMASLFNGALSLSVSHLNSMATVTWEDFLSKIPVFKNFGDKNQLNAIKMTAVVFGLLAMVIAFGVTFLSGVIDSSQLMTSATSGPLLGVFLLAMLFPVCNGKGAASGMIIGHIITLWITFGSLTIEKTNRQFLPLSTSGCNNESFSAHSFPYYHDKPEAKVHWVNATDPSLVYVEQVQEVPERHFIESLYSMTYMYYCVVGCLLTVVIGIIVSYITGTQEGDEYDSDLIHPLALKISNWFPGKPRKYLPDLKKKKEAAKSMIIQTEFPNSYRKCDDEFLSSFDPPKYSTNGISTISTGFLHRNIISHTNPDSNPSVNGDLQKSSSIS